MNTARLSSLAMRVSLLAAPAACCSSDDVVHVHAPPTAPAGIFVPAPDSAGRHLRPRPAPDGAGIFVPAPDGAGILVHA